MAVMPIRLYPDPTLREKAVLIEEIGAHIRKLAGDMIETLHAAPGVGLAAPQVGEALRLVVVDITAGGQEGQIHILVNPAIEESEGEQFEEEGCLSLPEVTERVTRPARLRVRALNLEGREIILDAQGPLARILHHEIDHLEGVLLFDHLGRTKRDAIKRRLKKRARSALAT